jgi:hypothetical protein
MQQFRYTKTGRRLQTSLRSFRNDAFLLNSSAALRRNWAKPISYRVGPANLRIVIQRQSVRARPLNTSVIEVGRCILLLQAGASGSVQYRLPMQHIMPPETKALALAAKGDLRVFFRVTLNPFLSSSLYYFQTGFLIRMTDRRLFIPCTY